MHGFIILAIIGTEKLIVTEFDGQLDTVRYNYGKSTQQESIHVYGLTDGMADRRTEIPTPISHPAMSRCDKIKNVTSAKSRQFYKA